ncbi:MAG: hypothetical protein C0407_15780 [Desulfobacca sp.]|nr:hypothetical protein [Desulfobacca sp.]
MVPRRDPFSFLKQNPLTIFSGSKTPIGLYARQKWGRQDETSLWRNDFSETVESLFSGHLPNGSWNDSLFTTLHRLFGLHLTVRKTTEQIDKSLEWLLSQEGLLEIKGNRSLPLEKVFARDLKNFPFSPGPLGLVAKCAILFLSTIFGKQEDPRVIHGYERIRTQAEEKGRRCTWPSLTNFMRAFIVHPIYADSEILKLFLAKLAEAQKSDGTWEAQIPFYQTVNALGHLDLKQADEMLLRAFKRVREKQNRDGTWGMEQKEWNTFLVVHALIRKTALWDSFSL